MVLYSVSDELEIKLLKRLDRKTNSSANNSTCGSDTGGHSEGIVGREEAQADRVDHIITAFSPVIAKKSKPPPAASFSVIDVESMLCSLF